MNLQVRRAAWRGRQAVHLPSAFHRPLLGILLGRGHRPGRGVSPPGCLNVLRGSGKEKLGGHRLRAPGLGWRGGGGDNWMDMPPRRHPSTPSTPGPLRASGARNSLSPTLIAIRWRKWKITALGNWRAMVPGACAQQEDESASPTPAGTWGTEPKPGAGGAGARGWWGEAFPWAGEQGSPPCPGPTFSWPRGAQGNSEQRFPCGNAWYPGWRGFLREHLQDPEISCLCTCPGAAGLLLASCTWRSPMSPHPMRVGLFRCRVQLGSWGLRF